jgi:hypothetical protein
MPEQAVVSAGARVSSNSGVDSEAIDTLAASGHGERLERVWESRDRSRRLCWDVADRGIVGLRDPLIS